MAFRDMPGFSVIWQWEASELCHVDFKLYQHNINQHGIASKQIRVCTVVKFQVQSTVE